MREKGILLSDISDIVSRSERTITRWIKEWHHCRMASIFTGHEGNGNASKLTDAQRLEIKTILKKPPSEHGLPKAFWDVPTLKEYVDARFGTVYESDRSYHFLLKFSHLSFKYPDTFDRKRDDSAIEQRLTAIRKEIAPLLSKPSWEVFAADEVRIELEACTRRAWLQKGKRTIVKVNRTKEAQNYLGLLNQTSFVCHTYEMPWQNQDEVLKALRSFLDDYPNKKICIVWDNAAFHRGKKIKAALKEGELLDRVHLVSLPPYAPDKNPIEKVWNTAKGEIANIQRDTFSETKSHFVDYISSRKFAYQI
jgi:transposase